MLSSELSDCRFSFGEHQEIGCDPAQRLRECAAISVLHLEFMFDLPAAFSGAMHLVPPDFGTKSLVQESDTPKIDHQAGFTIP